jgi:hypothetical protein
LSEEQKKAVIKEFPLSSNEDKDNEVKIKKADDLAWVK